jgi:hypothetical protein
MRISSIQYYHVLDSLHREFHSGNTDRFRIDLSLHILRRNLVRVDNEILSPQRPGFNFGGSMRTYYIPTKQGT